MKMSVSGRGNEPIPRLQDPQHLVAANQSRDYNYPFVPASGPSEVRRCAQINHGRAFTPRARRGSREGRGPDS